MSGHPSTKLGSFGLPVPMSRLLQRLSGIFVLYLMVVLMTGCSSADWLQRIEASDALPLWQKVAAIALATLVSEDLACIAAGILASRGALTVTWAITASFLGIFLGDLALYALGRIGGIALLRRAPFRWLIKENQIVQAEELFRQNGAKLIFSSRLLPGSRLPVYAAAGVLNYPFFRFTLFMAIAGMLSAFILVILSFKMGEVVSDWLRVYEAYAIPVFIGVIAIVWLTVKLFEILATRRSRLVALARFRRAYQKFISLISRS